MTTQRLCHSVIEPATKEKKCAYITLLKDKHTPPLDESDATLPLTAPATCFVSHAWLSLFSDLVDCVEQYEETHPNTYYWLDILSNNQHNNPNYNFEWWTTTFKEAIPTIGNVVLVMTPWNDPLPLKRVWCLYEMYTCIACGEKVESDVDSEGDHGEDGRAGQPPGGQTRRHTRVIELHAMIPRGKELEGFKRALSEESDENGSNTIITTLVGLDVARAEAFNPADKEKVFSFIRRLKGGVATLNNTIKGHLREWYVSMCIGIAEKEKDATLLYNVGGALMQMGNYDKALEVLQRCLCIVSEKGGEMQLSTAEIYGAIGCALCHDSHYDKAMEYYEKSLAIKLATVGKNHPSTAILYHNMANIYLGQGELDKALHYNWKSVAINRAALGENHHNTAANYNGIAFAYDCKGEHDKALEYYNKSLAIKLTTVGGNHPDTAGAYGNMAHTYKRKGEHDKALKYYEKGLAITLSTLGENHPNTERTYNNMADVYDTKGDYRMALAYHEKCLASRIAILGESHIDTARSYLAMGTMSLHLDNIVRARALLEKAKAIAAAASGGAGLSMVEKIQKALELI